jgi:hypothetical protein
MPILIIALVLVGIVGSIGGLNSEQNNFDESDVIVRTPSGGLVRSGATPVDSQPRSQTQVTVPAESPTSEPEPEPVQLPPLVTTLSPQNLEDDRVLLRGQVTFPAAVIVGDVYVLFSDNAASVASQSDTTTKIVVQSRIRSGGMYTKLVNRLEEDTTYYYRFCFADTDPICSAVDSFTTVDIVDEYLLRLRAAQ